MTGKPREEMNMVDATESIILYIKKCHVLRGRKKTPDSCMLALAAKEQHPIKRVAIHRNIVWMQFNKHDHWTRYQSTPTARTSIACFDKTMKDAVRYGLIEIPVEGFKIELRPPRGAISLAKLRSPEFKRIRAESAKRRAKQPKRQYSRPDSLTLEGVRASIGYRA